MKNIIAQAGAAVRYTTYDNYTPNYPQVLLLAIVICFIVVFAYFIWKEINNE